MGTKKQESQRHSRAEVHMCRKYPTMRGADLNLHNYELIIIITQTTNVAIHTARGTLKVIACTTSSQMVDNQAR